MSMDVLVIISGSGHIDQGATDDIRKCATNECN